MTIADMVNLIELVPAIDARRRSAPPATEIGRAHNWRMTSSGHPDSRREVCTRGAR
ncbi:MAG TPA: hypothetical protein VFX16_14645 [Pseudonocardiaceae bacterium]|nr:hypothetical protein [Pseudonocardiaceae bacterium]